MYLFLNDSSLYPENIQLLKNLTNHSPYWLGGFSIKSLIKQEERLTMELGYMHLKLWTDQKGDSHLEIIGIKRNINTCG